MPLKPRHWRSAEVRLRRTVFSRAGRQDVRLAIWVALLLSVFCGSQPTAVAAEGKFSTEQLEFFEKEIRPLLARRCHECHGEKKQEGGLRLDSRQSILAGGDTGPAIVPGKPQQSLLIDAVNYGEIYQMPPRSKLPDEEIARFTRWVALGAPWLGDAIGAHGQADKEFDLEARRQSHWAWQPVRKPDLPPVADTQWPRDAVDRFVLARLEQEGLQPAEQADRRTLIRRAYFDLIGLPPEPEAVDAFVADESPDAFAQLVDQLLASPHFGERWGRHWLDLVRYAESRGHEFDADAPNAFEYRDYVIRALNADVPYDRFVQEHIAGDLLPKPRLHPVEGYNESIIGTGFWFLGEWVHSPVSARKDETDRFDNMIDVMSKTFLGMTLACARCHDHKFDAISQRDYYALAGYLQSSTYRLARFETMQHNRRIARQLAEVQQQMRQVVRQHYKSKDWSSAQVATYLRAAAEAISELPSPAGRKRDDVVIADFESGGYDLWETTGTAFGQQPETQETIADYQGDVGAQGRFFVNSHRHSDKHTGTLTSPEFLLQRPFLRLLVGGGAHQGKTCVNLLVDGKVVATATGANHNRMQPHWWNLVPWEGKVARIQVVDRHQGGWGNIGCDHFVLTDDGSPEVVPDRPLADNQRRFVAGLAADRALSPHKLIDWVDELRLARREPDHLLHGFARTATLAAGESDRAVELFADLQQQREQQLRRARQALDEAEVVVDYRKAQPQPWITDGFVFGAGPERAGQIRLQEDLQQPVAGIATTGAARFDPLWHDLKLAPGTDNDFGRLSEWMRPGRTLRSPTFTLETDKLYYLVRGAGFAYVPVASHRLNRGPLHGEMVRRWDARGDELHWVEHSLARYRGQRLHVEFSAPDRGEMSVLMVVQASRTPGIPHVSPAVRFPPAGAQAASLAQQCADRLQQSVRNTLLHEYADDFEGETDAAVADWVVRHADLFDDEAGSFQHSLQAELAPLARRQRELSSRIGRQSRAAMAMLDGDGENERLLVRGNYKTPGDPVPRRFLEAIAGPDSAYQGIGSGRLQLAEQMLAADNPLTSRVIVNRLWHHLTGRGIVASVDNLGVLGRRPTHPQLLDHLATTLVADGWSLKRMIRRIMLTATYQMASQPRGRAAVVDPDNRLLHSARVGRLPGEVIRDAMLAISGRLDARQFGRSVPVHLTAFMQGRGRPQGGPLDGAGRRSIYIAVRRNFLSPMMLTFDAPIPFTTIGRRNVSNVPAQALILMNHPLVAELSRSWARRMLQDTPPDAEARIGHMYRQALSRLPDQREMAAARTFLQQQGQELGLSPQQALADQRVWADLGHVLWNVKEFIFIQ